MTPEYQQVIDLLPKLTQRELQDLKLSRIGRVQLETRKRRAEERQRKQAEPKP